MSSSLNQIRGIFNKQEIFCGNIYSYTNNWGLLMKDIRNEKLADILVNYSCQIKEGEKILISAYETDNELVKRIIDKVYEAKGLPFVQINDDSANARLFKGITQEQLEIINSIDLAMMEKMDAYIAIRTRNNVYESSIIPPATLTMASKILKPSFDQRVKHTKWCVLRYPNQSMAQLAKMNTEDFTDFYYDVCTLDYEKMSKAMDSLVDLMDKTDQVHIKGPGTDLSFSIKDIPAIKCAGEMNIPDGEVFTAPVRDSINGHITFNTLSASSGKTFENIYFEFKDGKIINAKSNHTELLDKILDTDEGSRYVGEFAIGVNPYIIHPMMDTLFDEKIQGSFHLTPGSCYDEAYNGNDSAIHWDLVSIQTQEYGGGEIWFDNQLVRKDGLFVIDSLKGLNPENLK